MKINHKLVVLSLLCCFLLGSCAFSKGSQKDPISTEEAIIQPEQAYINEAMKILASFNLSGTASMEYRGKSEDYDKFDLIVESDDFDTLLDETKIRILKSLDEIYIPNADLILHVKFYSNENEYDYYGFLGTYKNGEKSESLSALSPSSSSSSSSSSSTSSSSWFSGGTLHQSTVAEWRNATYSNRLATAADFIAATQDVNYGDLDEFKSWAIDLETCISTAVSGGDVDSELVSFISALCTVQLFD